MAKLSEAERRQILSNVPLAQRRDDEAIIAAVETILTARLSKIEALADAWDAEGWDYPAGAAYDLRAALADPESDAAKKEE